MKLYQLIAHSVSDYNSLFSTEALSRARDLSLLLCRGPIIDVTLKAHSTPRCLIFSITVEHSSFTPPLFTHHTVKVTKSQDLIHEIRVAVLYENRFKSNHATSDILSRLLLTELSPSLSWETCPALRLNPAKTSLVFSSWNPTTSQVPTLEDLSSYLASGHTVNDFVKGKKVLHADVVSVLNFLAESAKTQFSKEGPINTSTPT